MAKSRKTKKTEEVVPEVEQPVIDTGEVKDAETEVVEVVTVPEVVVEEPKKDEPVIVPQPMSSGEELSMGERIIQFMKGKAGKIRLNEFLKSLYPVPKFNQAPDWASQRASKQLRVLLETLNKQGYIKIENNMHLKLGSLHYNNPQSVTQFRSLADVIIYAYEGGNGTG